jgi:hypothetical protein
MANKVLMLRADLNPQQRSQLLAAVPPRYHNVYCRHLVWAYGVSEDFVYPKDEPVEFTIAGHHVGPVHEALVGYVRVGDDFHSHKPNGEAWHITLSTCDGVPPKEAGNISAGSVRVISPGLVLTLNLVLGHPVRLTAERR